MNKTVKILIVITSIISCMKPVDNNIIWTAKYNFADLYKQKVYNGHFNAGGAIEIEQIEIPTQNTIILSGTKNLRAFDSNINKRIGVLFISNDKGKTYKEIEFNNTNDEPFIVSYEKYTTLKIDNNNMQTLYLFENSTHKLIKIDEYIQEFGTLYSGFDDEKYAVYETVGGKAYLVNLFNLEERYEIPPLITMFKYYYNKGNGVIIYKRNQELVEYDLIHKKETIIKRLGKNYEFFKKDYKSNEYLFYISNNAVKDEDYEVDVYDENEDFLYREKGEDFKHYRYKNFVCDFRYSKAIYFSYDYGKTWKEHRIPGFSKLTRIVGFYKDEFLVLEGIFFRGDSPESGGRIMVGEFQK